MYSNMAALSFRSWSQVLNERLLRRLRTLQPYGKGAVSDVISLNRNHFRDSQTMVVGGEEHEPVAPADSVRRA